MKILISGSSGLVGTELKNILKEKGHKVISLIRQVPNKDLEPESDSLVWDPEKFPTNPEKFEGFDVVIHLAGASIAGKRWNEDYKDKIFNSRVKSTELLSQVFVHLKNPPKIFICASAVGYYGDRGTIICTEESAKGRGFLAEVCNRWEEATNLAKNAGIRTVNLRFGVILAKNGGALAKMLTPFKLGLGGILGSGHQYMSWVTLDDVIGVILFVIDNPSLSGPLNVVAPNPVTNKEFTKTLGEVLHRPTIIPVPAFVLRILLGTEMADEMLLNSTRAMPERLLKSKYTFIYPDLNEALIQLLELK